MTTLHTIGTLKIAIYARDHLPPHLHVVDVDVEWRFTLTGMVMSAEGRLSRKQLRAVEAWIAGNAAFLQAEWIRHQSR